MSIKSKLLAAVATLTMAGVSTVQPLPASAATPQCGQRCIGIFSARFGTYAQPGYVETVFQGVAMAGQPTIMHPAGPDPEEDIIVHRAGMVTDFFAAGMVSADVNSHYGTQRAVQVEYAPYGVPSGLCAGLATTAYQNEGLTLQPCSIPATTVWIVDAADSPATATDGYTPLVNGSTTDFTRPLVMTSPDGAAPTDGPAPRIHVSRLHLCEDADPAERAVPGRQLWGTVLGVLTPG
jgi:hypothetical protein